MRKFYLLVCVEIVLVAMLVWSGGRVWAESGHAEFNGFVAFEGLAYVDKQPATKVELVVAAKGGEKERVAATVEASEHGIYHFATAPLGEYVLRISAAGYKTYETAIYIPSDFIGNLGVMMKKVDGKGAEAPKN